MVNASLRDDYDAAVAELGMLQRRRAQAEARGLDQQARQLDRDIERFMQVSGLDQAAPDAMSVPDVMMAPRAPRAPMMQRGPMSGGQRPSFNVPGSAGSDIDMPNPLAQRLAMPEFGPFAPPPDTGVNLSVDNDQYLPVPLIGDVMGYPEIERPAPQPEPSFTEWLFGGREDAQDREDGGAPALTPSPSGFQFPAGTVAEDRRTDAFGIPLPEGFEVPQDVETSIKRSDISRGGLAVSNAVAQDPQPEDDSEFDDVGFAPDFRRKVLEGLGTKGEKGAEQLGMALLGFGSGLLSGGPDFGAALGNAFSKGVDQFVATKKTQEQAALNDRKIAIEDERLARERARFEREQEKAAYERTGRLPPEIARMEQEKKLRKQGYRIGEGGEWEADPSYVPGLSSDVASIERDLVILEARKGEPLTQAEIDLVYATHGVKVPDRGFAGLGE